MFTKLQGQGITKTYQSYVQTSDSDMTLSDPTTMEVNMKDCQAVTAFSADLQVLCKESIILAYPKLNRIFFVLGYALFDMSCCCGLE